MNRDIAYEIDAMLHQAVKSIDALFDDHGYAEKHPELIAAFLIAASNNNIAESNTK